MHALRGRLGSISWALTDQVLFAGSNFLLGLLTARWMAPEEFGALATALVVQTLIITTYEAAFTEPMTVFGAGRYRDRFRSYFGTLLVGHLLASTLVAVVMFVAGLHLRSLGHLYLAGALLGLGASAPLVLLRYLSRRACYAISRPRSATISGGVYAVTLFTGVALLADGGSISILSVFACMAAASTGAALATIPALRPMRPEREMLREIPVQHWNYSRWSVGTALIRQMPQNVWYFILPLWAGLEGNAALRALSNLNLFMGHMLGAFGMLLLPSLVRAHAESPARFRRISLQAGIGLTAITSVYWVSVWAFGEPLVSLMYDGKYVEYAPLLAVLGFSPVAGAIGVVSAARAQAAERPDIQFRSSIVTLVAILPGIVLAYFFGLAGVVYGSVLVTLVGSLALLRSTANEVSEWTR